MTGPPPNPAARPRLLDAVQRVLATFRAAHGWQPGMVWNPYTGTYEHPPDPSP